MNVEWKMDVYTFREFVANLFEYIYNIGSKCVSGVFLLSGDN